MSMKLDKDQERILVALRNVFGEKGFTVKTLEEKIAGADQPVAETMSWLEQGCLEWDEEQGLWFLTHEALSYEAIKTFQRDDEALGLGELEDTIVTALEKGKDIPWGKVAMIMWFFFLFIIVYTVIEQLSA